MMNVRGRQAHDRDGGAVSTRSAPERPNIRQVAMTAGVSHMTVSRGLEGHAIVMAGARDKVLAAADELGYRRNTAARALATQRTLRVGAMVETESESGRASSLRAIHRAARQRGYSVSSIALDVD